MTCPLCGQPLDAGPTVAAIPSGRVHIACADAATAPVWRARRHAATRDAALGLALVLAAAWLAGWGALPVALLATLAHRRRHRRWWQIVGLRLRHWRRIH